MTWSLLRASALALAGPALLLTAACGGGGDSDESDGGDSTATATAATGDATRPSGSSDSGLGYCDVKVSGDVEAEFRAPGGRGAVGADYFMSKDELRQALKFLGEEPTDAELNDDVVDLMLLIINCTSTDGAYSLSFYPGNDSTYSDVPFGKKNYVVPPGGILGGAAKGEMGVLVTLKDLSFAVSEPGEFNITEWNDDHIAGDFSFVMKEPELFATGTPKSVTIEGEFDLKAP